jgi:folylpolyglutamate synthase/dihydropteroate synthase
MHVESVDQHKRYRGDLAGELKTRDCGCMAQQAPTVKDAINIAAAGAGRNDIILVTGSFAIAGEAKRLFLEKKRATAPASLTPPVQSEPKPADSRQPKSC